MAQIILFQNLEHLGNKFQEILKGKRSMYLEREKKKHSRLLTIWNSISKSLHLWELLLLKISRYGTKGISNTIQVTLPGLDSLCILVKHCKWSSRCYQIQQLHQVFKIALILWGFYFHFTEFVHISGCFVLPFISGCWIPSYNFQRKEFKSFHEI